MTLPDVALRAARSTAGDLDRMVAVIVDHGDAVRLAGLGEAPLDALELAERLAHDVLAEAHLLGDGDGGERVLHVVLAEHRQAQPDHAAAGLVEPVGDDDVEDAGRPCRPRC